MELFEAIKNRRSVREYKDDPVPDEDLEKIIEMATWAPSGGNRQCWRFLVIEDKEKSKGLADVIRDKSNALKDEYPQHREKLDRVEYYYTLFENAPVTIAIIATEYPSLSAELSGAEVQDGIPIGAISSVAAAIQNLLLSAHSLGYGTCWMTGPLIAKEEMEDYLGVGDDEDLIAITPLGVPDEKPDPKPRKNGVVEYI